MKTIPFLLVLIAMRAACAQQLEVNGPGAALKHLTGINTENDPVAGVPVGLLAPRGDDVRLRVRGATFAPFILIYGSLDSSSTAVQPGAPATQWFDLDLQAPLLVITDGIGGGGVLPFFGQLDAFGSSDWTFGIGPAAGGLSFAFQAICADPAAFLGLDFSAAVAFDVHASSPATTISSDDATIEFYPSQPLCFAGAAHQALEASTNGWIRFGVAASHPDFDESAGDLVAGHVGGGSSAAPVIAVLWDDLDLSSGSLTMTEIAPGMVHVVWANASYFNGAAIGSFQCTLDGSGPALQATLDWSALAIAAPASRGLVGASCALAGAAATMHDLVTAGAITPLAASGAARSFWQDFNAQGPLDVQGLGATIADVACSGDLTLF